MIHNELLPAIGQIYCEQSMSTRRPIIIKERESEMCKRQRKQFQRKKGWKLSVKKVHGAIEYKESVC